MEQGGLCIELLEPLIKEAGPVGRFLARRGPGLHHVALLLPHDLELRVDGFQLGARARQFEHHRAAEAEADRSKPAAINLRQTGERRKRGEPAGTQPLRLGAQSWLAASGLGSALGPVFERARNLQFDGGELTRLLGFDPFALIRDLLSPERKPGDGERPPAEHEEP